MQEVMNDPMDKVNQAPSDMVSRQVELAPLSTPRSVIVCRSKQCAPIKLSMSKEYIFNSLVQMMQNNNHQKALICAADSGSHSCFENYVSLPITVGITPAYMYLDSVKISDVTVNKGSRAINLMLNYNVTYNGQTPECAPDKTLLFVKNTDNIVMEDKGFRCKMTTVGETSIKTLFMVDFIDLDYGFIGGYYSVGLSGPAYGGGSGYMMLRLSKTSYPLLPMPKANDAKNKTSGAPKEGTAAGATKATTESETDSADGVQVFPINYKK